MTPRSRSHADVPDSPQWKDAVSFNRLLADLAAERDASTPSLDMVGEAVESEEAEEPEPDAPPYVPLVVASATNSFAARFSTRPTQGHKMVRTPVQGNPRLGESPGTTWLEHPFKGND